MALALALALMVLALLTSLLFALYYFVLSVCFVSWLFLLGCQYQCN